MLGNASQIADAVHSGGAAPTRKRIDAAAMYAPDFGIATECGMVRCRTPEMVRTLLKIHAEASAEPLPVAAAL
jgi:hypothetical protein